VYVVPDFCGTPAEVDAYIKKMKENGIKLGQKWICTEYQNSSDLYFTSNRTIETGFYPYLGLPLLIDSCTNEDLN